MKPLVNDIVADEPATRPNMDEVVRRFDEVRSTLSFWKLRSRLIVRKDGGFVNFLKLVRHIYHQATYLACSLSPVPTP